MFVHQYHDYGREQDLDYSGKEFNAEIFPDAGLDLLFAIMPKGGAAPANTWLGLFTGLTASTVGGTASGPIASWTEVTAAGAYTRMTISSASWGTVGATQSGRGTACTQVTFATATAVWGTVNGFVVANILTTNSGTVWFGANFDDVTAVGINTNDVIKVTPSWVYTG